MIISSTIFIDVKHPSACPACGNAPKLVQIGNLYALECDFCAGPDAQENAFPPDIYGPRLRIVDALRQWELKCCSERERIIERRYRHVLERREEV